MHVPGMQCLYSILMSWTYLHFVPISDAKVITSRFPATVLNVRNDGFVSKILNEEKTGLNTVVYVKGRTNKEKNISNTTLRYILALPINFISV